MRKCPAILPDEKCRERGGEEGKSTYGGGGGVKLKLTIVVDLKFNKIGKYNLSVLESGLLNKSSTDLTICV